MNGKFYVLCSKFSDVVFTLLYVRTLPYVTNRHVRLLQYVTDRKGNLFIDHSVKLTLFIPDISSVCNAYI